MAQLQPCYISSKFFSSSLPGCVYRGTHTHHEAPIDSQPRLLGHKNAIILLLLWNDNKIQYCNKTTLESFHSALYLKTRQCFGNQSSPVKLQCSDNRRTTRTFQKLLPQDRRNTVSMTTDKQRRMIGSLWIMVRI